LGKRRTRIVIEMEEILVARGTARPMVGWCPECQQETQKATAAQAALLCQVDEERIEKWIREGRLHISEGPNRNPLICLVSLERC